MRFVSTFAGVAVLSALLAAAAESANGSDATYEQRILFRDAKHAIRVGRIGEFRRIRNALDGYVLEPYLEFYDAQRQLRGLSPSQYRSYRERLANSPLVDRLAFLWLREQGRRQRWTRLLEHYEGSHDAEVECYRLRALYSAGKTEESLNGVAELWVVGESQPKACDPIFDVWISRGHVTSDLAWKRLLLALNERSYQLARYLFRFFPEADRRTVERLYDVHRNPGRISIRSYFPDTALGREAVEYGMTRYALREPDKAKSLWQRIADQYTFGDGQRSRIAEAVTAGLADIGEYPDVANASFAEQSIEAIADAAVAAKDWGTAAQWINSLSDEAREDPKWRYWLGRSLLSNGESNGEAILGELAGVRTYYGFLAAHDLQRTASLNHAVKVASDDARSKILDDVRVRRLLELYAVDEPQLAYEEWQWLIPQLDENSRSVVVRQLADIGWTYAAIVAASTGDTLDLVDVRFPMPYLNEFRRMAHATNVPLEMLLAIARQESAFNAGAVSTASARGLMQLIPSTANHTADNIHDRRPGSRELLDPRVSIELGSHHVAELMDRYDGHRILVAAAYNAGSSAAGRWLKDASGMSSVAWIEQIPYKETRGYVKGVLAFSHIYGIKIHGQHVFLSQDETTIP